MISDEKAPAFSAKTLNLPTAPDDLTNRIVALSRERYTQEREVVEKLVRGNAGLAIDAAPDQAKLPPPKPKVQAQLNQLGRIDSQTIQNQDLNKVVGANILQALTSENAQAPATQSEPHKKRRRGKRGGRKNKKGGGAAAEPVVVAPSNKASDEQTIHLR
jgi:hypothetical protein